MRNGLFLPTEPKPPRPESTDLIFARLALDRGQLADAERCLWRVLDAEPESAEARSLMGVLHERLGEFHSAYRCYKRALELDQQNLIARASLRRYCVRFGLDFHKVKTLQTKVLIGSLPTLAILVGLGLWAIVMFYRLGGNIDVILRENYTSILAAEGMKEAIERMDSGLLRGGGTTNDNRPQDTQDPPQAIDPARLWVPSARCNQGDTGRWPCANSKNLDRRLYHLSGEAGGVDRG